MELDYLWLRDYVQSEIARLRKIEESAQHSEEKALGEVAKYTQLISLVTMRDDEYRRSKQVEEKKLEHWQGVLANVSPKLDKLSEQWTILNNLTPHE